MQKYFVTNLTVTQETLLDVLFFLSLQRINPSAEMVMIDRMFNQDERASLTRDKRLALVDPGK